MSIKKIILTGFVVIFAGLFRVGDQGAFAQHAAQSHLGESDLHVRPAGMEGPAAQQHVPAYPIKPGVRVSAQHEGHQMPAPSTPKQEERTNERVQQAADQKKEIFYCPMHPTYTSDKPGDCPICNMKLVKKQDPGQPVQEMGEISQQGENQGVYISPEKQQLIGVKLDKAMFRPMKKNIRTVGRVAFDPALYMAQQEYIEAAAILEKVRESGLDNVIKRSEALVEAAAFKLKLQGLDTRQIEELGKSKTNDTTLLLSSPDSVVTWVYATIYEYELEWVSVGQEAVISAVSYPGKEFKGMITAIDPVFDAQTRSVRARIKVENTGALLKPDMYVDVRISSDLGAYLVVPREAIMDSGVRTIVFVSSGDGYFKAMEIKTGASTDDYTRVLDGVKEGDTVVVSGNFLIDSESTLKSALGDAGLDHGH